MVRYLAKQSIVCLLFLTGWPIFAGKTPERESLENVVAEAEGIINAKIQSWFAEDQIRDPRVVITLTELKNAKRPEQKKVIGSPELRYSTFKGHRIEIDKWNLSQWLLEESWQSERVRDRMFEYVLFESPKSLSKILHHHPEWQSADHRQMLPRDYFASSVQEFMQLADHLQRQAEPSSFYNATKLFFEKLAQRTSSPILFTDLDFAEKKTSAYVEILVETEFTSAWEFRIKLPESYSIPLLYMELIAALNRQATFNPSKRKLLGLASPCQDQWREN